MEVYVVEGLITYEGGTVIAVFKDRQCADNYISGLKEVSRGIFDGYYVTSMKLQ